MTIYEAHTYGYASACSLMLRNRSSVFCIHEMGVSFGMSTSSPDIFVVVVVVGGGDFSEREAMRALRENLLTQKIQDGLLIS